MDLFRPVTSTQSPHRPGIPGLLGCGRNTGPGTTRIHWMWAPIHEAERVGPGSAIQKPPVMRWRLNRTRGATVAAGQRLCFLSTGQAREYAIGRFTGIWNVFRVVSRLESGAVADAAYWQSITSETMPFRITTTGGFPSARDAWCSWKSGRVISGVRQCCEFESARKRAALLASSQSHH